MALAFTAEKSSLYPGSAADDSELSQLVEPDEAASAVVPHSFRRSRKIFFGIVLSFGALAVAAFWRAFGPCSTEQSVSVQAQERSLTSFAEDYPHDLVTLTDARDDQDALRQWLSTASLAGKAAEDAPRSAAVAMDTASAVNEAMHVKDPSEARKVVQRAMRRAVGKTQAKRRDLKKYIKSQRRGLRKKASFSKSPKEMGPSQQAAVASCVFNVLEIGDTVAGIAADLNDASKTCKYVKLEEIIGIAKASSSDANTTHARVCSVNVASIFAGFGLLATSLATAVDGCAATLIPNVDALCSAAVTGVITAVSGLAGVGTIISASCSETGWYRKVPPGLVPSNVGSNYFVDHPEALAELEAETPVQPRKLSEASEVAADHEGSPAPARQLLFGGGKGSTATHCTVEIMDVAWALADAALSINSAAHNGNGDCPPAGITDGDKESLVYRVEQGLCTVDIAGVLQALLGIITTLQLAYVNCADELNLQALCGSGINGIFVVLAALAKAGPGLWLACDEAQLPPIKKLLKVAEDLDYKMDGAVTSVMAGNRRLLEAEDLDPYARIDAVKGRYSSVEKAFESAGYDLNDKDARYRKMPFRRPAYEEALSLMEEHTAHEENTKSGLLESLQTCS